MANIKEKLKEKIKEKTKIKLRRHSYGLLYSQNDCLREKQTGKKVKWLKDYQVCINSKDEILFRLKSLFFRPDEQLKKLGIKNAKDAYKSLARKTSRASRTSSFV